MAHIFSIEDQCERLLAVIISSVSIPRDFSSMNFGQKSAKYNINSIINIYSICEFLDFSDNSAIYASSYIEDIK